MNENWRVLTRFLPKGWQAKAKKLGVLRRKREIKSASTLLRILLIHISDGCSLRETAVRARMAKLANISDVALLKKLKASSEWLRWMSVELLKGKEIVKPKLSWLDNYQIKTVDASTISEPGSTGTDWRLHYSLNLFNLNCDQFLITRQDVGESFVNYKITKNDLLIGDRVYGRTNGMSFILENQGHFITRIKNRAFNIHLNNEKKTLYELVKDIKKVGELKEFDIQICSNNDKKLSIRLCVIKKSKTQADKAIKKAIYESKKKHGKVNEETIELHKYVILATSLDKNISAKEVLELYRYRWQVELAFKRLKSIVGLGHLPKKDYQSCKAWLHGKIFVGILAQLIVDEGRRFSPWGYPF